MIHRFSVANYYSIHEEAVLDLCIPGTAPDLPSFRRSAVRPDVRLPTVAVLVGPNGSGKTTLLRALVMTLFAASARPTKETSAIFGLVPFYSDKARAEPTKACLEFEANGLIDDETSELLRYELVVDRHGADSDDWVIGYEALHHYPKGRPRRLFERGRPGAQIYVAREFGLSFRDARLKAVGPTAAVIPTLAMLNVPLAERIENRLRSLRESDEYCRAYELGA